VTPIDVAATIRKVAALRELCLRLPHIATASEMCRLARFTELAAAPAQATSEDVAAIAAGWRQWWREGHKDRIRTMAERLPAGLIEQDRRLASYLADWTA